MVNKVSAFFKRVGRTWFILLVIVIIIIFFYNQIVAIIISIVCIVLLIIVPYIPHKYIEGKLITFLKEYFMIEDDSVAEIQQRPLREIRQQMFDLMQKQENKPWLIVFLNKRYIFFHEETIQKFIKLYNEGYDEKEMLDELQSNDLRAREQVKIIKDTLSKLGRLGEREVSVKERKDKLRFT